jgi:RNA polymerase sigma factor (TIGR02999 family)
MPTANVKANNSLTTMLQAWHASQKGIQDSAFNSLIDVCYEQLRRMAATRVRESGAISVSPTELLHDAIICIGESDSDLKNSKHFLATMSLKMRALLIDHARANLTEKRGGDLMRVTLTDLNAGAVDSTYELVALDDAFNQLDVTAPRSAQVMHLTYFAGMQREDIAKLLDISLPMVDRELRFGRAFTMDSIRGEQ